MLQGQRDLLTSAGMILSELAPGRRRAAGRVLRARRRRRSSRGSKLLASYASDETPSASASSSTWAKGWSASARREAEDPARRTCPPTTCRSRRAWAKRTPPNIIVLPVLFEGQVQGRARAGVVRALQPDAPGVPRSAHRVDRHRAQHDRGEHAHGGPAQAVAVARRGAAEPAGRAAEDERRAARRRPACSPSRTTKSNARTRKSSRPARRSKKRPSSSRSRRSTSPSSSRTCRTSCGRRSTACSSCRDQLSKNPEGNLTAKQIEFAKTIHSLGQRPARRSSTTSSISRRSNRARSSSTSASCGCDDLRDYVERTFRHVAEAKKRRLRGRSSIRTSAARDAHRRQAPAADHQEPAVERLQVHARRAGVARRSSRRRAAGAPDNEDLEPRGPGARLRGDRHRHRHPARQAADHLRGVPAGRRLARAASTAARASAWRSAASYRALLGGEIRLRQRARRRQHVHAVPAAGLHAATARATAAWRSRVCSPTTRRLAAGGRSAARRAAHVDEVREPRQPRQRGRTTTATTFSPATASC